MNTIIVYTSTIILHRQTY